MNVMADRTAADDESLSETGNGVLGLESVQARKRSVRGKVQAHRSSLTAQRRSELTAGLTEQLINLVTARGARSVSCYLPIRDEPDTLPFIAWAHREGIETLMPSVREDGLLDWIRDSGEGSVAGALGIPEPLGEHLSPLAVSEVDLMLVPASGVDERGTRLGWGRGYFDRNLGSMERRPPVFAIVFDEELFDELPEELHDIRMTGAVTPSRIVHFDR